MKEVLFRPFLAMVSGVDSRSAPPGSAQALLNVLVEGGEAKPRYGYRNLQAAQRSFAAGYGLVYLQGYNTSYAEVEEYVSFEDLGAGVAAYSRAASDLSSPTAITGATSLHASKWRGVPYRNVSYFFNRNHATKVYRHTIGDTTSWTGLGGISDPSTTLGIQLTYGPSDAAAYPQLSWAGTTMSGGSADITYGGRANSTYSTLTSDNELRIVCTSGLGSFSISVDLNGITAGIQNWEFNDAWAFTIVEGSNGFKIDPASLKVTLTNNDGTPIPHLPIVAAARVTGTNIIHVFVYSGEKTRADWDNIRHFKIEGQITNAVAVAMTASSPNNFTVSKPFIGCCFPAGPSGIDRDPSRAYFGQTYYASTPDAESGVGGVNSASNVALAGYNPLGTAAGGGGGPIFPPVNPDDPPVVQPEGKLGVWVKFTMSTSADANVDNNRLYWANPEGGWNRIVTQTDATPTYTMKLSYQELLELEPYIVRPFGVVNAIGVFPALGTLCWLFAGGGPANVRYGRVGAPEQFAPPEGTDLLDDEEGADYTLAPNFADEPVGCGFEVDGAVIIPGRRGIYAQVGTKPVNLSPSRRLGGAPGCAGVDAAAQWRDEAGNQGVAYVDAAAEGLWFVRAFQADPDDWPKAAELIAPIRGQIRTWLIDEQSSLSVTASEIQVYYNERTDALHIALGRRELILRRPDLVTGQRGWHRNEYNLGGASVQLSDIAASVKWGTRWMRSDGKCDENEWNTSTLAWIVGSNRDGGNVMPTPYWSCQVQQGPWRQWKWAHILRDTLTDRPTLTPYSDRQTGSAVQVASGATRVGFHFLQQGYEHWFKLELQENSAPIRAVIVTESGALSMRGL